MITKIQSFTDVITNSSSTVFVMTDENATYYSKLNTEGCVSATSIDLTWIKRNSDEVEMICSILNIDPEEIATYHKGTYDSYYEVESQEIWENFIEKHKEQIEEAFDGLYWVDIEDHFEDAYEVTRDACNDAEWFESRH